MCSVDDVPACVVAATPRYGAGMQLDFVASSPGSYLVLWNSVIMRMACVSNKREPDAVAMQPRLAGAAAWLSLGQQQGCTVCQTEQHRLLHLLWQ